MASTELLSFPSEYNSIFLNTVSPVFPWIAEQPAIVIGEANVTPAEFYAGHLQRQFGEEPLPLGPEHIPTYSYEKCFETWREMITGFGWTDVQTEHIFSDLTGELLSRKIRPSIEAGIDGATDLAVVSFFGLNTEKYFHTLQLKLLANGFEPHLKQVWMQDGDLLSGYLARPFTTQAQEENRPFGQYL